VRAQLAHHVERRPVIRVRHGAFQMDLWHHDCSTVTSLLYESDGVS
jgi:pterin-4a-carbinolamine dehydratase